MDIRQLKYFVSTVQLGSVVAAAEAHFVTQPAISAQLKRLEETVGEKLLIRRGRRLVPTPTGETIVRHAEAVIASMAALEQSVSGMKALESGHLRLGTIDAASVYVLPDIYRDFHSKYPQVRIEVAVGDTRHLIAELQGGHIELATTTMPIEEAGLHSFPVYREELVPVAARAHEVAKKRSATLQHINDTGVIAYPARASTRRIIDDVFAEHAVVLRPTMEISSPEAMKRLTQAGLGVSILPRPVVAPELGQKELVEVKVPGVTFERVIGMVHRDPEHLSPAARVFLEMVRDRTGNRNRGNR